MNVRRIRSSLIVLVAISAQAVHAATLTVPIKANVKGTLRTIGGIVANDKFRGLGAPGSDLSGLTATFTFGNKFGILDNRYDFDWVQVAEAEMTPAGGTAFFPTPLPTIDPRPAANPDKYPFYYSKAEWNANTFAGQTLHVDRMTSTFGDVPSQPKDFKFSFSTFLVVRDHGKWSLNNMNKFYVLGGFQWMYAGADGTGDTRGVSTVGDGILGPVDPKTIDRINSAISSGAEAAASDAYRLWKTGALGSFTLVPEPSSALLAAMTFAVLLRRRASRGG